MAGFLLLPAGNPLTSMSWVGKAGRVIVESGLPPLWPWHFAAHVLLLQGLIPQSLLPYAYITLLGPAWSLSTEWQFYLLIGLLAPRRLGRCALALLAMGAAYHCLPPLQTSSAAPFSPMPPPGSRSAWPAPPGCAAPMRLPSRSACSARACSA